MDAVLRKFLESSYPNGRQDLYCAFILRCREFAHGGGYVGMVTQHGWLFLESMSDLRSSVLDETTLHAIAHLGSGAFEEIGGAVVSSAAFTLRTSPPASESLLTAINATDLGRSADKQHALLAAGTEHRRFVRRQALFASVPDNKVAYWMPAELTSMFQRRPLSDHLLGGKGLGTSDNDRFLRCFWEVMSTGTPRRWFPYTKGGGFSRWVGLEWLYVNYGDDGAEVRAYITQRYPYLKGNVGILVRQTEFYRKPGLTHSNVAQRNASFRVLPRDAIFSDKGPGFFNKATQPAPSLRAYLAYLNTRWITYLLRALSPSIEFQLGQVLSMPRLNDGSDVEMDGIGESCLQLKSRRVRSMPLEMRFIDLARDDGSATEALLAAVQGWNERAAANRLGLTGTSIEAVVADTGYPPGWQPLIAGYDALPQAPDGTDIPEGLSGFLATLEHRQLSADELAALKKRVRAAYEAGPGAKVDDEESLAAQDDEDGAALGARIPIPTETFIEELADKLAIHPISVYWLLEELKANGVVSPPLRKAELIDYVSVSLLRMLGYRWPEQDAYEATHGPILDPDLVDPDGIIPLVPCANQPTATDRLMTRLERQFGEDGAASFVADFRRYVGRDLDAWLNRDFFKAHTRQFKNRPIAWHLRSPEGHFSALVLYHRLSRDTLVKLRSQYAGDRIATLRNEQDRARGRGETARVSELAAAIEDVEAFRQRIEAIERGDTLADRIRCRWKDEEATGRPGPYAPDIDDGVKVNIRPFQENGLLAAKVISKW